MAENHTKGVRTSEQRRAARPSKLVFRPWGRPTRPITVSSPTNSRS